MIDMAEKYSDRARSAGPKLAYKKSVSHVINRGDQHTDDGWDSQL